MAFNLPQGISVLGNTPQTAQNTAPISSQLPGNLSVLGNQQPVQPVPQPAPIQNPQMQQQNLLSLQNPSNNGVSVNAPGLQPAPNAAPPPQYAQQPFPQQNVFQPPAQNTPQQSIAGQALNGGGVQNKQQISNYIQALQQAGAGGNNIQMNSAPAGQPIAQNLVNPNAAFENNANTAQNYNTGGYQTAVNQAGGGGLGASNMNFNAAPPPSAPAIQPYTAPSGGLQLPPGSQVPNYAYLARSTSPAANNATANYSYLTSDENLKTAVEPATRDLSAFLNSINAHSYQYKHPELDGQGTFVSPMAQELEKTEIGKSAVIETPRGKMVDYARLGGVNLAAVSVVHREVSQLQSAVDKLRKQFSLVQKKGR